MGWYEIVFHLLQYVQQRHRVSFTAFRSIVEAQHLRDEHQQLQDVLDAERFKWQ
jgi:hypothetical protein